MQVTQLEWEYRKHLIVTDTDSDTESLWANRYHLRSTNWQNATSNEDRIVFDICNLAYQLFVIRLLNLIIPNKIKQTNRVTECQLSVSGIKQVPTCCSPSNWPPNGQTSWRRSSDQVHTCQVTRILRDPPGIQTNLQHNSRPPGIQFTWLFQQKTARNVSKFHKSAQVNHWVLLLQVFGLHTLRTDI